MNLAVSIVNNQVLLIDGDPGEFLVNQLKEVYWNICNKAIGFYCDVDLCCKGGQIVKAHSAVLAVASPFFKNILVETWTLHSGASILLPDFK